MIENGFGDIGEEGIPECWAENGSLKYLVAAAEEMRASVLNNCSCGAKLDVGVGKPR